MEPQTPPRREITSDLYGFSTPQTESKHSTQKAKTHIPYTNRTPNSGRVQKPTTPPSSHHIKEDASIIFAKPGSARRTKLKLDNLAKLMEQEQQESQADSCEEESPSTPILQSHMDSYSNVTTPLPSTSTKNDLHRYNEQQPTTTGLGICEPVLISDMNLHTPKSQIKTHSSISPIALNEYSDDEEDNAICIRRAKLDNPFVEKPKSHIKNPFISPEFSLSQSSSSSHKGNYSERSKVDYDQKVEFYNSKSGKYFERDLTDEERKIKPKKLDFGQEDVGQKFIRKNLNGLMMDSKKKNGLDFHIFEDKH